MAAPITSRLSSLISPPPDNEELNVQSIVFKVTAAAAVCFLAIGLALAFIPVFSGAAVVIGIVLLALSAIIASIALGVFAAPFVPPPPPPGQQ